MSFLCGSLDMSEIFEKPTSAGMMVTGRYPFTCLIVQSIVAVKVAQLLHNQVVRRRAAAEPTNFSSARVA
jgi:ABC-type enterochelin transport system permease subunit